MIDLPSHRRIDFRSPLTTCVFLWKRMHRAARITAVSVIVTLLTSGVQAQESLTLRKIKQTGIITLGYRESSIPFSFLSQEQQPIGYSIDLCSRVVDAVRERLQLPDLQTRFVPVTPATRMPMLINNIIDIECGSTTNNPERQKQISFLTTTYVASTRFLTKRLNVIRSLADLRGKKVVSTAGTTSMRHLVNLNQLHALQMDILVGQDHADSFRMVESDRAFAFLMDDVLLMGLLADSKSPADFSLSDETISTEPYGIGVRRGDLDFKQLADFALLATFRNGDIQKIYDKWFQSSIPPRNVNLRLPMNAQLRKAIVSHSGPSDAEMYK